MTDFTGGTWRSLVDGAVVSAIPDVQLDHFYFAASIDDITQDWPDEDGAIPLNPVNSPSLGAINSTQSVVYDPTNPDYHEGSSVAGSGANDEWTVVSVFDLNDDGNTQSLFQNGDDSNGWEIRADFNSNAFVVAHQSVEAVSGGTPDTNAHVLVATYDGTDGGSVIVDLDGSEIINTVIGNPTAPSGAVRIGSNLSGGSPIYPANGNIGAAGHEGAFADATRRDELTNKLADAFGITVST